MMNVRATSGAVDLAIAEANNERRKSALDDKATSKAAREASFDKAISLKKESADLTRQKAEQDIEASARQSWGTIGGVIGAGAIILLAAFCPPVAALGAAVVAVAAGASLAAGAVGGSLAGNGNREQAARLQEKAAQADQAASEADKRASDEKDTVDNSRESVRQVADDARAYVAGETEAFRKTLG